MLLSILCFLCSWMAMPRNEVSKLSGKTPPVRFLNKSGKRLNQHFCFWKQAAALSIINGTAATRAWSLLEI